MTLPTEALYSLIGYDVKLPEDVINMRIEPLELHDTMRVGMREFQLSRFQACIWAVYYHICQMRGIWDRKALNFTYRIASMVPLEQDKPLSVNDIKRYVMRYIERL